MPDTKRTFRREERVILETRDHSPVEATVLLVSENQTAVAFRLDKFTAVRNASGAMAIMESIACMQDDNGRLTDLFGNEWFVLG